MLQVDRSFAFTRVFMPCSATKDATASGLLPLWQLYRGPLWLTLVSRLRAAGLDPDALGAGVVVLSALHGWQRGTSRHLPYEHRMTSAAAEWMRGRALHEGCDARAVSDLAFHAAAYAEVGALRYALHGAVPSEPVRQVIVAGAGLYREVMLEGIAKAQAAGLVSAAATVMCVAGGIGAQRSQLGRWLDLVVGAHELERGAA